MKVHELKTWPTYFFATKYGLKTFELRKNDRDFQAGDILILREWIPETEKYSGDSVVVQVTYTIKGPTFDLPKDLIVMSVEKVK